MAPNEEVLEELYELLDSYFEVKIGGGIITPERHSLVEPQLDRAIFRELILSRITTLIMKEFSYDSKED